jgi:hypothetical protein
MSGISPAVWGRGLVRRAWKRLAVGGLFLLAVQGPPSSGDEAAATDLFEKSIRPLLAEKCQSCHGAAKAKSGLRLTDRGSIVRGGDSGAAVVPGVPDQSLLIRAVRYLDEPKMPPKAKLSAGEIAALERWVASGAPWPSAPPATTAAAGLAPTAPRSWWAFQPVRPVPPPTAPGAAAGEIDAFLLQAMQPRGITPAGPADRRTWIRRATFDLTGLPPTPEAVEAFVGDRSPMAFEKVVDRLLASPAHGERWARHWLDVARYADYYDANPKTRTASCELTEAWRYRDWVVEALNRDLPFDQFIIHQVAGDLLPAPDGGEVYPAGLVATTFLSNGVWDRGDADKEKIVSDMVDDNIDTVGKAFLGLTLGCARCHDHKFDPISQEDYYGLAGIFYSTHILRDLGKKGDEYVVNRVPLVPRAQAEPWERHVRRIGEIEAKLTAIDKEPKPRTADVEKERAGLASERDRLQKTLPPEPPLAMAVQEGGTPGGLFPGIQDVPIHSRGSYARRGPIVARRLPRFLAGDVQRPISRGSGRRELARWVASTANPLTARVIVNRVWQWHFGEGLVSTPSNFGLRSEPPSHPELLDWLAARFVEDGWSLKALHRRIMLSDAYRRSSVAGRDQLSRDPENRWLGRFAPRRLDAEEVRDALLSVSGQLDRTPGGPADDVMESRRRSLYVQTARWDRSSYAMLFDAANPDASTEKRTVSTVAPQALLFLNHPFVLAQARHLAERLVAEVPGDDVGRIGWAYRLLFERPARPEEVAVCREFLLRDGNSRARDDWPGLAHLLLCSNEFVYVD